MCAPDSRDSGGRHALLARSEQSGAHFDDCLILPTQAAARDGANRRETRWGGGDSFGIDTSSRGRVMIFACGISLYREDMA
ncbi:hypothetical protein [Paraburkholderia sp. BL25I1N1]|uniref:hypothetical protein n=1 Tax=Paraburkholderia sp. BL25I1N1 TaxID=1938804 RepID=UPI000D06CD82|nr:hypothetical protein [Paraburkholderia sp. BL25I1N1]